MHENWLLCSCHISGHLFVACRHHLFPLVIIFTHFITVATEKFADRKMPHSFSVFSQCSIVCTFGTRITQCILGFGHGIYAKSAVSMEWTLCCGQKTSRKRLTQSQNSIIRKLSTLHHNGTTTMTMRQATLSPTMYRFSFVQYVGIEMKAAARK